VFGPREFDTTGQIVVGEDGMGMNSTDGCTPYTNDVTGKLVLVDRGNCTFKTKTLNAQNGNAVGVIIANNTMAASPPPMGDDSNLSVTITIPTVSVTLDEGATIKTEVAAGTVTATIHRDVAVELDGSLDSTLIAHEFGHYLHHRLSFCNTTICRAMSEGWGDFTALMLLARPGDNLMGAYPFSVYTTQGFGSDAAYYGIRRAPYSVDFDLNALSFRHMADGEPLPTNHPIKPSNDNSEVHNAGEIWAEALWEVYVALQQAGQVSGATFDEIRNKMARYVVTGLQLAPVDASPVQTRDALLAAALAASPADHATMIAAFARRGLGSCAVAPAETSLDFKGIVESNIVAGKPELANLALADGCDGDGILDTGETALVKARVTNQGHAPLTDVTLTVTSQIAGVTVVSPPTTLAKLDTFASTDLEIEIALAPGFNDGLAGDLALQVTAAGACETTTKLPIATRLNVDDKPTASDVDTFDTKDSTAVDDRVVARSRDATRRRLARRGPRDRVRYVPAVAISRRR
jgi:large repetitive protein